MSSEINWSAPIEAVHEDGRVVSVLVRNDRRDDFVLVNLPGEFLTYFDRITGLARYPECGWTIRNAAQVPETAPTAPSGGEVGPEVVERMIALVRAVSGHGGTMVNLSEARAIVALLPEPVDADLLEARERAIALLSKTAVSNGIPDQHPAIIRIREGRGDHNSFVVDILAAIKRGRELATTDSRGEG